MNEAAVRNSKQARIQFIREYELPIDLVEEPYFSQRLVTMDCIYGCRAKWEQFVSDVAQHLSVSQYIQNYEICTSAVAYHMEYDQNQISDDCILDALPFEEVTLPNSSDTFPHHMTGKMCLEFRLKDDGYKLLHDLMPEEFKQETFADYIGKIVTLERWKTCPDFRRKAMTGIRMRLGQLRTIVFGLINEKVDNILAKYVMNDPKSLIYELPNCLDINDLDAALKQLPKLAQNAVEYDFFIPQELGDNAKFGYLLDYFRDGKVVFRNLDERFANQIVLYLKHDYIMKSDLKFNFEDHLAEFKRKIDNPLTYYPSRFANYHAVS